MIYLWMIIAIASISVMNLEGDEDLECQYERQITQHVDTEMPAPLHRVLLRNSNRLKGGRVNRY